MSSKEQLLELWRSLIGSPKNYGFTHSLALQKKYDFGDFTAELYLQANGPGTFQRVVMAFPKNATGKLPAVAVPFYFPEAMLGFELDRPEEILPSYTGITMMAHLVRRGYVTASADAYHLTYLKSNLERGEYQRWPQCGEAINKEHPEWSGIGKLTADTMLLVDALAEDPRVDAQRIGIAGHSLGGKMAFYAGCLDARIKAILASDFGIGWDQTNWNDTWYWGSKVESLKARGIDHSSLLACAAPKPFCLLAGQFDNDDSYAMMQKAPGYENCQDRLVIYNHATGHRPPMDVLNQGYDFLDKWCFHAPEAPRTPGASGASM